MRIDYLSCGMSSLFFSTSGITIRRDAHDKKERFVRRAPISVFLRNGTTTPTGRACSFMYLGIQTSQEGSRALKG